MKLKRSACIEPMYAELPFYDRFQAAKDDGFEYVEFWSWTDKDLTAVKKAADKKAPAAKAAAAKAVAAKAPVNDYKIRDIALAEAGDRADSNL